MLAAPRESLPSSPCVSYPKGYGSAAAEMKGGEGNKVRRRRGGSKPGGLLTGGTRSIRATYCTICSPCTTSDSGRRGTLVDDLQQTDRS